MKWKNYSPLYGRTHKMHWRTPLTDWTDGISFFISNGLCIRQMFLHHKPWKRVTERMRYCEKQRDKVFRERWTVLSAVCSWMNEHTHACIAPLFLRSPISVLYYVPELVAREPLPLECVAAAAMTVTANGGGTHHTDYTQTTDKHTQKLHTFTCTSPHDTSAFPPFALLLNIHNRHIRLRHGYGSSKHITDAHIDLQQKS